MAPAGADVVTLSIYGALATGHLPRHQSPPKRPARSTTVLSMTAPNGIAQADDARQKVLMLDYLNRHPSASRALRFILACRSHVSTPGCVYLRRVTGIKSAQTAEENLISG